MQKYNVKSYVIVDCPLMDSATLYDRSSELYDVGVITTILKIIPYRSE